MSDSLVPVDRGSSLAPPLHHGSPGVVPTYPERCKTIDYHYDLDHAVICAMFIFLGIIYTIFGYRCFKAVMFLTGFTFASVIIYLMCMQDQLLTPYASAGLALSAGVLMGLIAMLVQYIGLFMTGFHTGLLISIASLATAEQFSYPLTYLTTLSSVVGSGLLFAVLNLQWPKVFTVIGTCVYGGATFAGALDFFVERLLMVHWVMDRITLRQLGHPCWFSWLVLSIWPGMVFFGLITQLSITGRGIHHQQLIPVKHQNRQANVPRIRTREQRAELRQKKYRYLYQVRTAHGDVISQNYVQALQHKVIDGAGESSTLQSDATHLTILPDATTAHLSSMTDDEIQQDHCMHSDLHYR